MIIITKRKPGPNNFAQAFKSNPQNFGPGTTVALMTAFGASFGALSHGKRGAMIGALLGAAIGGTKAIFQDYKKDKKNDVLLRVKEYLGKVFNEEKKLYPQYNAILWEFDKDHKFPKELDKFLSLRSKFLPKILEWVEKEFLSSAENVGKLVFETMSIPVEPHVLKEGIEKGPDDNYTILSIPDPDGRNLVITCNPYSGEFGIRENGKIILLEPSLKSVILKFLDFKYSVELAWYRREDDGGSPVVINLIRKYKDFISANL